MVMTVTLAVEMIVLMGMNMIVTVGVDMVMGMGNTIMGVLMGMGMLVVVVMAMTGHMIMMNVHRESPLLFSFIIPRKKANVKP